MCFLGGVNFKFRQRASQPYYNGGNTYRAGAGMVEADDVNQQRMNFVQEVASFTPEELPPVSQQPATAMKTVFVDSDHVIEKEGSSMETTSSVTSDNEDASGSTGGEPGESMHTSFVDKKGREIHIHLHADRVNVVNRHVHIHQHFGDGVVKTVPSNVKSEAAIVNAEGSVTHATAQEDTEVVEDEPAQVKTESIHIEAASGPVASAPATVVTASSGPACADKTVQAATALAVVKEGTVQDATASSEKEELKASSIHLGDTIPPEQIKITTTVQFQGLKLAVKDVAEPDLDELMTTGIDYTGSSGGSGASGASGASGPTEHELKKEPAKEAKKEESKGGPASAANAAAAAAASSSSSRSTAKKSLRHFRATNEDKKAHRLLAAFKGGDLDDDQLLDKLGIDDGW